MDEIKTLKDLQDLADKFGFQLEMDNDGQYVLYTDLFHEDLNRFTPESDEDL